MTEENTEDGSPPYIFIDHVNISTAGQRKLKPNFIKKLVNGQDNVSGCLCTSKSTSSNSTPIRREANKYENIQVLDKERNKGADTGIAHMMAKTLYKDLRDEDRKKNAVFIIAAGDCDYKFQVDDVLENNVQVELWLFKHGTTEEDGRPGKKRLTYPEDYFVASRPKRKK